MLSSSNIVPMREFHSDINKSDRLPLTSEPTRYVTLKSYRIFTALNTTNKITPLSRVLLEKLIVAHLFKNLTAFYRTRRFVTVFTRARHWSLTEPHESNPHPLLILFLLSPILQSSHLRLGLPSDLFPSHFLTTTLYLYK
jgi:hypothetical protein